MAEYDPQSRQWVLWAGDRAIWVGPERTAVPVNIELVTPQRVYLRARAAAGGKRRGEIWFEGRHTRRVVPEAAYVHGGKAHYPPDGVRLEEAA
ncbi:hypothetical protein M2302_002271 [Micromonospora sp. A200]|uniref:hypothetical protein n=1 Tax=Micromonospora sp. A200 TaxID=2940568 RepID=UPI002474861C|nr:hypothetical protein [Micromonospora sp. A200]MDH6462096.1 hypothetical protein [Micromonospora sp. A200]